MNADRLREHLLEQAQHLARRERTRPRQASLRRAISSAYYALFHFLVREATNQLGPNLNDLHFNQVYRWFDHGTMDRVAKAFSQKTVRGPSQKDILLPNNNPRIEFIATCFVDLQELRHSADYDPGAIFLRAEVLENIDFLYTALKTWPAVKNTPEANAFLISLLLWEYWNKRR